MDSAKPYAKDWELSAGLARLSQKLRDIAPGNQAPIPIAMAYQFNPDSGLAEWTVDVMTRTDDKELELTSSAPKLSEAIHKICITLQSWPRIVTDRGIY